MGKPLALVVGLGNPGPHYAHTRHNAGVWFVEKLALQQGASFRAERNFFGRVARVCLAGRDLRLLIPDTYMNESGKSVAALVHFYRLPVQQCLVAHDELDFTIGTIRLKQSGGLAGHKGLGSISNSLGGTRSFARLRIGVGHPGDREQVTGHVLGRISGSEKAMVDQCIDAALETLPLAVKGHWDAAMQKLHSMKFVAEPTGGV